MRSSLLQTLVAGVLLSASVASVASAQHIAADGTAQTFNLLTDQYFEQVYFKFSPTAGTSAGLHQYDTQLEDYSAAEVQREIAALHAWDKKLAAIDPKALRNPAQQHPLLASAA
jgi:uncharacterized protein (DUF885 family)